MRLSLAQTVDSMRHRWLSPSRRVGPIGIEFGAQVIHLCQMRPEPDGRFSVIAHVRVPFSGMRQDLVATPSRLKKLLRDGMRDQGFSGRRVVAAMPADKVRFTPITFKNDGRRIDELILKMLAGRVEGDIADYVVDYLPVRSNREQEESLALAAIAKRADVLAFLDALGAAGFEVEALDIGPAAIRRLFSVLYTGSDEDAETILVVNTGVERSYLSVISGRRLLFDQPVDFGEQKLLAHLGRVLDLSPDASRDLVMQHGLLSGQGVQGASAGNADGEVAHTLLEILKHDFLTLVEEINRILIFTAAETRGKPIGRVCLLGGVARWPGAERLLRDLIDVAGDENSPQLSDFIGEPSAVGPGWSEQLPELAVATGLALRGLVAHE